MKQILTLIFFICCLPSVAQDKTRAQVTFKTNKGDIVVELYNETPLHRDNMLRRVKSGIFTNASFYRVIENFMIQFGPYEGEDTPEEQASVVDKESLLVPAEFRYPELYHRRGVLAAAREGDDVNPEQKSSALHFYIVWGKISDDKTIARAKKRMEEWTKGKYQMAVPLESYYRLNPGTPHLDGAYTIFGEVVKGLDLVGEIQKVKTDENDKPLERVTILKAKITRKGKF